MRIWIASAIALTTVLNLNIAAAAPSAPRTVNHPGSLELLEIGWQNTAPQGLLVKAHTKYFVVFDGVVVPSVQSIFLLEHTQINPGDEVLDLGTGCGIQAIFAADKAKRVVATDIDAKAVENTKYNLSRYQQEKIIDVRQGDLFGPIKAGEKFDVILLNLVYPFSEGSKHLWELHERFFAEVNRYLKRKGRIYYQAGLIANIPHIQQMAAKAGLRIMRMNMAYDPNHVREPIVFVLQRP